MSERDRVKKSIVLIDTNIFLRVFIKENDQMFNDCQNVLELVSSGVVEAYTMTVICMEVQFVLASVYHKGKEKISDALAAMSTIPTFKILDDSDIHMAISLYRKTGIKFTDCLIASSQRVQSKEASVLSYDRDFDHLGVSRIDPVKLLAASHTE